MILNITNTLTVLFGIVAIWAAVKIYTLTRARAAFWMVIAAGYITIVRAIISIAQAHPPDATIMGFVQRHTSFFIFAYWPLKAFALVLLYYAIKSVIPPKAPDVYDGPDRRKG